MRRSSRPLFGLLAMVLLGGELAACRGQTSELPPVHLNPNMDLQPKYKAQSAGAFFADGRTMRRPVEGTVARGLLKEDDAYFTGKVDGQFVVSSPVPSSSALLQRGQQRFNIYCSPCHDRTGSGKGIVIASGMVNPPSYHSDTIRKLPDGQLFDVITHGVRTMPAYNVQVPVADRWAIVAYVRALQRSQQATLEDVPEDRRASLQ